MPKPPFFSSAFSPMRFAFPTPIPSSQVPVDGPVIDEAEADADADAEADGDGDADADADAEADAEGETDEEMDVSSYQPPVAAHLTGSIVPTGHLDGGIKANGLIVASTQPAAEMVDADEDLDAEGSLESDFAGGLSTPPPLSPAPSPASPPPPAVAQQLVPVHSSHSPTVSHETNNSKTMGSLSRSPSLPYSSSATSSAPHGKSSHKQPDAPIAKQRTPASPTQPNSRASTSKSRPPSTRQPFNPAAPLEAGQLWSERNASVPRRKPDVKCAYCAARSHGKVRHQMVAVMPDGRLAPYLQPDDEEADAHDDGQAIDHTHQHHDVPQANGSSLRPSLPLAPGAVSVQVVDVPEALEACHLCGSAGHASCLSWSEQAEWKLDVIRAYPWTCEECKRCEVCARKPESEEEEATFLFCSCCDRAWHTTCVGLPDVPPGWWSCPSCVQVGLTTRPEWQSLTFVPPTPRPNPRRTSSHFTTTKKRASSSRPVRSRSKTALLADLHQGHRSNDDSPVPPKRRRRFPRSPVRNSQSSTGPSTNTQSLPPPTRPRSWNSSLVLEDGFHMRPMDEATSEEEVRPRRIPRSLTSVQPVDQLDPHFSLSPPPPLSSSQAFPRCASQLLDAVTAGPGSRPKPRRPPAQSASLPAQGPSASPRPVDEGSDVTTSQRTVRHQEKDLSVGRSSSHTGPTRIRLQLRPSAAPPNANNEDKKHEEQSDADGSYDGASEDDRSESDTSEVVTHNTHHVASRGGTRLSIGPARDVPPMGNPFDGLLSASQADMSLTWPSAEDRALFAESVLPPSRRKGPSNQWVSAAPTVLASAAAATGVEQNALMPINRIRFDGIEIATWFASPLPDEYSLVPQGLMYLCGKLVYSHGNVRIYEVDGAMNKMYCQNLCLLAKMFLDHKTVFYDVAPFLFYICVELDGFDLLQRNGPPPEADQGAHFVGYFSKEKDPVEAYNLSCIMTLPFRQRKGWGNFLIDYSYHLSRASNTLGSPEKPLSDLGALTYQRYWALALAKALDRSSGVPTIDSLTQATGMVKPDVLATLRHCGWIVEFSAGSGTPAGLDTGDAHRTHTRRVGGSPSTTPAASGKPRRRPAPTRPHRMELCSLDDVESVEQHGYKIQWNAQEVRQTVAKHDARGHIRLDPQGVRSTASVPSPPAPTRPGLTLQGATVPLNRPDFTNSTGHTNVPGPAPYQPVPEPQPLAPGSLEATLTLLRKMHNRGTAPVQPVGAHNLLGSPTPFPPPR